MFGFLIIVSKNNFLVKTCTVHHNCWLGFHFLNYKGSKTGIIT